jgi:hypothetical protein
LSPHQFFYLYTVLEIGKKDGEISYTSDIIHVTLSSVTMMRNLNRFLVLGLLAAAAVFMAGLVTTTTSLQQADAVSCDRSVIAVCGVCVNAAVIAQDVSQRCNQ